MFVLSHTPNTWGLIQSLLQCVLAPAGDLLPLFTLTGGAGRAAPPVPVLVQAAGCSPSAGQVSTAPSPPWSSIHRQVFAHSPRAEPAPATVLGVHMSLSCSSACPSTFASARPQEGDGHQTDFSCHSPYLDHVRVAVEKPAAE